MSEIVEKSFSIWRDWGRKQTKKHRAR